MVKLGRVSKQFNYPIRRLVSSRHGSFHLLTGQFAHNRRGEFGYTTGYFRKHQADIYYNILQISRNRFDENPISAGKITFDRLERMLQKFIPDSMLSETLYKHYTIDRIQAEPFKEVPSPIIGYAERLLTQIIGPSSAHCFESGD